VEAQFGPLGDSANLDARKVHRLRRMYHRLGNLEPRFSPFGDGVSVEAR
jgi:hypothetical protein